MTVDELRKALNGVPGDLVVVTRGYEAGYDGVKFAAVVRFCEGDGGMLGEFAVAEQVCGPVKEFDGFLVNSSTLL